MADEETTTAPETPPAPPEPAPETHHATHVTREEFDSLKGAIDGLTQRIAELAPASERDEAPGGIPWTHRGGR